jgi:hypothetical protein
MQKNLIKNVHQEAKDFYKTEYKENKVHIKAQNIDDLMNNFDLYSYLFDSELSNCQSESGESTSTESASAKLPPDKFVIKAGNNPILYEPETDLSRSSFGYDGDGNNSGEGSYEDHDGDGKRLTKSHSHHSQGKEYSFNPDGGAKSVANHDSSPRITIVSNADMLSVTTANETDLNAIKGKGIRRSHTIARTKNRNSTSDIDNDSKRKSTDAQIMWNRRNSL